MKLEQIKCKPFDRAKNLSVSASYIIGCTGLKAVILDKQLNPVHTVEGLEYVYSAQMSPDEKYLLLISNGNRFYIVDIQTFEKTRVVVKAPYNYNLEGRGCWSFDGKSIWIPVQQSKGYIKSTLRRYDLDDLDKYQDFLADKYCLTGISRIESNGTYFLTGYDRLENNKNYFIYFDGAAFQAYPLDTSDSMIVLSADVDLQNRIVTLYTSTGCQHYLFDGKKIRDIQHPAPVDKTLSFSDAFVHLFHEDLEKQANVKDLSASLGLENIPAPDRITKYKVSSCGKYFYLALESGLYLMDANTADILAFAPEEFGVQNFEEITPGVIAIATWRGVKLYQIAGD